MNKKNLNRGFLKDARNKGSEGEGGGLTLSFVFKKMEN